MPQLDFFTVKAQLFCLLFSIFIIYSFLLKYALPAYDVFLRLKIKKVVYYRLSVENLNFLSLSLKSSTIKYVNNIGLILTDFSKIYFNFLSIILPISYFNKIVNLKNKKEVQVPLVTTVSNTIRPVIKETYRLNRKV